MKKAPSYKDAQEELRKEWNRRYGYSNEHYVAPPLKLIDYIALVVIAAVGFLLPFGLLILISNFAVVHVK